MRWLTLHGLHYSLMQKYINVLAQISDHSPLILKIEDKSQVIVRRNFKFKNTLFKDKGLRSIIEDN